MLPFVSLSAVTTSGAGSDVDLVDGASTHALLATWSGTPSGNGLVVLEGSLDEANWQNLGQVNVGMSYASPQYVFVTGHIVRYVRATIPGGQYPTGASSVTATILSGRS